MDEKRFRLERIMGQDPQAVVLFAGAMRFDIASGLYVSGDYADRDENSGLISAGYDRVLAARDMCRYFPSTLFVTTSRTRDLEKPTYASVMKRELVEFSVPEANIVEENDSVDTITCIKAVLRIIDANAWTRVVFLSAAFHMSRIKAVLDRLECFADNEEEAVFLKKMTDRMNGKLLHVAVVTSDDILQETNPVYAKLLVDIKKTPEYEAKLAAELGGADRIRMGGEYNGYVLPVPVLSSTRSFPARR